MSTIHKRNYPVCTIRYETLDLQQFGTHMCVRDMSKLLFRMTSQDGNEFVIMYYNSNIRKNIILGVFTDARTAFVAHALARSELTCRTVPFASQQYIEHVHRGRSS